MIARGQLTIHADRGSAMTSKAVAQLLCDLGVEKTHSRPHVSNDNPHSEAQFKTLKYRPDFPELFGSIEDARSFCCEFFAWYNNEHRHSGIAMLTPATVHYGKAEETIAKRQSVLEAAYAANPTPLRPTRAQTRASSGGGLDQPARNRSGRSRTRSDFTTVKFMLGCLKLLTFSVFPNAIANGFLLARCVGCQILYWVTQKIIFH